MNTLSGLHHVTAICGDAQRTIDFYTDVLGLRLTKVTVNFDDPGSYHLYFSDDRGNPGTTLTFFVWPGAGRGHQGSGQTLAVGFTVPMDSLSFWIERLARKGVPHESPAKRFDETVIRLRDPDGLLVEIVAHPQDGMRAGWSGGGVPAEHALRGLHNVTLLEDGYERTAELLTDTMGFRLREKAEATYRFESGEGGPGTYVDIRVAPDFWDGALGAGTIHHVAFRTQDEKTQEEWRETLGDLGYNVSPALSRFYFHSIYFHEAGGVLFEIATEGPGFMADQSYEKLGSAFTVPPWLEPMKEEIRAALPPVRIPPFPVPA